MERIAPRCSLAMEAGNETHALLAVEQETHPKMCEKSSTQRARPKLRTREDQRVAGY